MMLYVFIILILFLVIVALLMTEKGSTMRNYIKLLTKGLDSGFKFGQLLFLGKIAGAAGIKDPESIFTSLSSLDKCTAEIIRRSKQTGTENDPATHLLLSSLYTFRAKIGLEQSRKQRGVQTTRDIPVGQRVRILLRGVGVFSSKVVRNMPKALVLDYPSGSKNAASSINWVNKSISVYFWRHDDAGYVFDTVIVPDPVASGKAVVYVAHADNLVRSQKRKSVRAACSIYGQMYLVKPGEVLENALEPEPGMKCLIEDLSEDGAMIAIGGKAVKGMQIKLQFLVHDVLIVMAGTVRAVDYRKDTNQSRIHFKSTTLNPRMRNAVLSFVYNILPEEEREELDAIRLTEEDGLSEAENVYPGERNYSHVSQKLGNVEEPQDLPDFAGKS